MFDGVHLGHKVLLQAAAEKAEALGAAPAAFTFLRKPAELFDQKVYYLSTADQRRRWIGETGVLQVDMINFTREFAALSPEEFIRYLLERYNVKALVAGFNYTFGYRGAGNCETLRALGKKYGFETLILKPVLYNGEPVSSTRVREDVAAGRMEEAAAMLTRPYELVGKVVTNRRIGSKMGYPTANLETDFLLYPRDGVYATMALLDKKRYPAVTNVGRNPTVDGKTRTVETYILDESLSLYGQTLTVRFLSRLRSEQLFGSIDELGDQIGKDVSRAKKLFGAG